MKLLKKLIRNILNIFSLQIKTTKKNSVDRRTTLEEVVKHIKRLGYKPKTVIDVGVATGTYELYKAYPKAKHLLIEPLLEFENDLKRISLIYKADYIMAAAGARPGTININVHPDLLGSSIYHETDGRYVDGVTRQVPVITIDDICRRKKYKGSYLIKLDVQGAECQVLDGAKHILNDIGVIILETHFFEFYIDSPQFYDIICYMKKRGFVVYDIFGGYNRPIDYALASVDMVFVKENGFFRRNNLFALPSQRENLNKIVLRNASNID